MKSNLFLKLLSKLTAEEKRVGKSYSHSKIIWSFFTKKNAQTTVVNTVLHW